MCSAALGSKIPVNPHLAHPRRLDRPRCTLAIPVEAHLQRKGAQPRGEVDAEPPGAFPVKAHLAQPDPCSSSPDDHSTSQ